MLDHLVQRLEDGSLPMDRIDRSVERYILLLCLVLLYKASVLAHSYKAVLVGGQ